MGKSAFLFPGQGESHSVGMGKDFYENFESVRDLFARASDRCKIDFKKMIFEGPLDTLSKTHFCQLSIYLVSYALYEVVRKQFPSLIPGATAGLSLGEYTAAVVSGSLSFEEGLEVVFHRGRLMQEACEKNRGTMAVVLGLSGEEVEKIVADIGLPEDLWVANLNGPGQVVVTGTERGVERICLTAKEKGAKRVVPLNVQGAFHSPLMRPAADRLRALTEELLPKSGTIPLYMNATGRKVLSVDALKDNLILQIIGTVRWESCIREMVKDGVNLFFEIGCGKVLTGLNRRIVPDKKTITVNQVGDLDLIYSEMNSVN